MIRHPGCSPSTAAPRFVGLLFNILLACTLFPAGTLSRQECEYRERQGIQHPEVRPHVEAPRHRTIRPGRNELWTAGM